MLDYLILLVVSAPILMSLILLQYFSMKKHGIPTLDIGTMVIDVNIINMALTRQKVITFTAPPLQ